MTKPTYKHIAAVCPCMVTKIEHVRGGRKIESLTTCGKPAAILDVKRTMARDGGFPNVYICLDCARREYPDLFPPEPQQLVFGQMQTIKRGTPKGVQYVPLNREAVSS